MLRLTGGEFRGRIIKTPAERPGKNTVRPTQARLRQALFNSIQGLIPDARVLDLFAGSGALGFEALSRGATSVTFVEESRSVLKLIEQNAADLKVTDRVTIVGDSAVRAAKRLAEQGAFDLIIADPPYSDGWEMKLIEELPWTELLAPGGCFCLEWGTTKSQVDLLPDRHGVLAKTREKVYGDSVLTTYEREG